MGQCGQGDWGVEPALLLSRMISESGHCRSCCGIREERRRVLGHGVLGWCVDASRYSKALSVKFMIYGMT